jgi:hypothetical protein
MFRRNPGPTGGVGVSASRRNCPFDLGPRSIRGIRIERGIDATPNNCGNRHSHSSGAAFYLPVLLRLELHL